MKLIKNALIYTMAGEIIENGSILIEEGRIKEVGRNIEEPKDVEIIDAGGKMVMPGFIEAHSHIGLKEDSIGFEGIDHNEAVDPITPHMRAMDGVNPMDITFKEALAAGVTTAQASPGSANVIGGSTAVIKLSGHRIDDMVIKEPAAMKIAFGENPKRVYNEQRKTPVTRMGIAGVLREALIKARTYMEKKEAAGGDITKEPSFDMKSEALIPVLKKEIPLKAHAHRADDIFTAIRIAREFDLDLTIDHCTDGSAIAEDLAREGYPAIVGPSLGHRTKFELKTKSFSTAKLLIELGLKVAITTDSPVIPLHHLPLCAGLVYGEGLDEMEALKAITINPAEIMGLGDRIGSIEVGKDADIIILDGHPLKDLDFKVDYTIIDGEVVYRR